MRPSKTDRMPPGARSVFLPPYSPDLNAAEMIFAKIKQALR